MVSFNMRSFNYFAPNEYVYLFRVAQIYDDAIGISGRSLWVIGKSVWGETSMGHVYGIEFSFR